MNKALCIYYSRTGLTKQIAQQISEKTGADLVEIKTDDKYEGFIGYLYACVVALSKKMPKLSYSADVDFEKYDKIIVLAPVWVEDACPAVKAFLQDNKDNLSGDVYFVLTHMSPVVYEKQIANLGKLLGKDFASYLSVQTRNHDWTEEVEQFVEKINYKI